MFGINYFKAAPSIYVQQSKNGRIVKKGKGLSFFYYGPSSSLIAVPTSTTELPFFVQVDSAGFQQVNIQGQLSYQITDIERATSAINFTVDENGQYKTDEPSEVSERIIRAVQVAVRVAIEQKALRDILTQSAQLSGLLTEYLQRSPALQNLGISLTDIAISNIKPNPETGKALEAEIRESLLRKADQAIYERRLASLAQEKSVKEAELDTQKALQKKEQELESDAIEAERLQMQQRFRLKQEEIAAQIEDEARRNELVTLEVENDTLKATAKAKAIEAELSAYDKFDDERLRIVMMSNMQPAQLIASSFETFSARRQQNWQSQHQPRLTSKLIRRQSVTSCIHVNWLSFTVRLV